ncbi:hypothetical protein NPIL_34331 [Nephila pilipes]|uniref:Uncharacterized protein n=1 Tax=Nephila pilipes TaxID=299642 RepID=A0A8X6TCX3_NEPPI|nr:hypothetical protein NPIL_34331 [Nephila pilipes]
MALQFAITQRTKSPKSQAKVQMGANLAGVASHVATPLEFAATSLFVLRPRSQVASGTTHGFAAKGIRRRTVAASERRKRNKDSICVLEFEKVTSVSENSLITHCTSRNLCHIL